MPYVISTKTHSAPGVQTIWDYSRRAVATLDEARTYLYENVPSQRHVGWTHDVKHLPVAGGTITLPDGTVIEVERVEWDALVGLAGLDPLGTYTHERILAAQEGAER
jgi:hypothetical protein